DGYEVASQLRALFQNKVRLVALTALGSAEDRKRCLEAGFDLHLGKPVDPTEVRNLLREVALAKAFSSCSPPGRPPAWPPRTGRGETPPQGAAGRPAAPAPGGGRPRPGHPAATGGDHVGSGAQPPSGSCYSATPPYGSKNCQRQRVAA